MNEPATKVNPEEYVASLRAEAKHLKQEISTLQQNGKSLLDQTIEATERGLQLRTLDDYWRYAKYVIGARVDMPNLVSKDIKTAEAIVIAVQFGAEVGLSPMQALQNVMVVNGRPSLWGDAPKAIVLASGLFDGKSAREFWIDESGQEIPAMGIHESFGAICRVRRLPDGEVVERAFTLAMARTAGLLDKDTWKKYPHRMLQLRARSIALRDVFPDVLKGLPIAEEIAEVESVPTASQPTSLQELTKKLKNLPEPEVETQQPKPPHPPLSGKLAGSLLDARDRLNIPDDKWNDLLRRYGCLDVAGLSEAKGNELLATLQFPEPVPPGPARRIVDDDEEVEKVKKRLREKYPPKAKAEVAEVAVPVESGSLFS